MPIYEYRCNQCGHQFEVIQKFSDDPLDVCEECQGHLSKLISQTSFQLKGSGWYITDYARKSSSDSTTKESKTDAKPADAPKAESAKVESQKTETRKTETSASATK